MCNTCNSCGNNGCGCNNGNNGNGCGCGCDVLLNTLKNLFAPIGGCNCGCGCRNCMGGGTLYLVNNLGAVPVQTGNTGCGCNNGNGGNNGCGCNNGNNGCGCNRCQTADAYYVRQYALCGCGCNG